MAALATATQRQALNLREAADRLGVSAATARRLALRGVIPAYRVGAQIRVDVAELEAWIRGAARNDVGRGGRVPARVPAVGRRPGEAT